MAQRVVFVRENPLAGKYPRAGWERDGGERQRGGVDKDRRRQGRRSSREETGGVVEGRFYTDNVQSLCMRLSLKLQLPKYTEYVFAFRSLYRCVPVSVSRASLSSLSLSLSLCFLSEELLHPCYTFLSLFGVPCPPFSISRSRSFAISLKILHPPPFHCFLLSASSPPLRRSVLHSGR